MRCLHSTCTSRTKWNDQNIVLGREHLSQFPPKLLHLGLVEPAPKDRILNAFACALHDLVSPSPAGWFTDIVTDKPPLGIRHGRYAPDSDTIIGYGFRSFRRLPESHSRKQAWFTGPFFFEESRLKLDGSGIGEGIVYDRVFPLFVQSCFKKADGFFAARV